MAGRGSLAGLLPDGDANAIVVEMANEVLPIVKQTPILAGVFGTDLFRVMPYFLKQIKEMGFVWASTRKAILGRTQCSLSTKQLSASKQLRQAAVNDIPNFATGGATFLYDDEEVIIPISMA